MCWIRADTELNYERPHRAQSFDAGGGEVGCEVKVRWNEEGWEEEEEGPLCSGHGGEGG